MEKFSPAELHIKNSLKKLRLDSGLSMPQGAKLIGFSVKKLEDIEATRDYGCHVSIDVLMQAIRAYKLTDREVVKLMKPAEAPQVQVVRQQAGWIDRDATLTAYNPDSGAVAK